MKLLILILSLFVVFLGHSQNSSVQQANNDSEITFFRGPVSPLKKEGLSYSSYTFNPKISPGLFNALSNMKVILKESEITNNLNIRGLTKLDKDGDYTINYTISRFKLNSSNEIPKRFLNAPAYHIGMESKLEIFDKNSILIYARFNPPHSNTYLTNPEVTFDKLIIDLVKNDFRNLINEFQSNFLYQPILSYVPKVHVRKKKKSSSDFNTLEFDDMTKKLNSILTGDRTKYDAFLPEQIIYWKKLIDYTDDNDERVQKDVVSGALTNLALISLFRLNFDEVKEAIPLIKKTEPKLIEGFYTPNLITLITEIETELNKEKVEGIAIEEEPIVEEYLKNDEGFVTYKTEGTIYDKKDKSYNGNIIISNLMPEIIDFRTKQTAGLLNAITSDPAHCRIEVFPIGSTKSIYSGPLKNVSKLIDSKGTNFSISLLGNQFSNELGVSTSHYGLIRNIDKSKNIALFEEYFPSKFYAFKKDENESLFIIPFMVNRKKSIINYFECNYISENANSGKYNSTSQSTYKVIFEDYKINCK